MQKSLRRNPRSKQVGRQLARHHVQPDQPAVAPAAHVQDQVAGRKAIRAAFQYFANRAARHRFAQLERSGIAFGVIHPPAHIRIDGKPMIANQQLARAGRHFGHIAQGKIRHGRQPCRTPDQMPRLRHIRSPSARMHLCWREKQLRGTARLVTSHLSRGRSSDGRALQSHCRGQGFDSPRLHQRPPFILRAVPLLARGRALSPRA
jgi:hypothetical protein